jgi:hypothetical protein
MKNNKYYLKSGVILACISILMLLISSCNSKTPATTTKTDDVTSLAFARKIMETQKSAAPIEDAGRMLQPELSAKYPDTFAGLWVVYTPEFHFVVAFTSGGEEAVQPYRQGLLTDAIEVRMVKYSLQVLQQAQTQFGVALSGLNFRFQSAVDVMNNYTELSITKADMPRFNDAVQSGKLVIPECAKVVPVDGLATPS